MTPVQVDALDVVRHFTLRAAKQVPEFRFRRLLSEDRDDVAVGSEGSVEHGEEPLQLVVRKHQGDRQKVDLVSVCLLMRPDAAEDAAGIGDMGHHSERFEEHSDPSGIDDKVHIRDPVL
ncbi:arginine-tRNA ligase [Babesia caballi]|uniref:Arginine-tRNA ligase n=1 Tax=Babesia caballi TaxID=5871 RepID=A0AAV4M069_BABCB|nr:arginine-tRNA ligase [Babesia caballi]